ncbi:MAG TPA: EcsC family protein [Ktedonobacterales bacterium]|nr:EcsC family protein [Ktedonobacterales bacterium]
MATSNDPGNGQNARYMNPAGGVAGQALAALPPDIQALLKPGKTSERIQHAIAWAARRDPRVLAAHQKLDHSIKTFEDIKQASLANKDKVAREFARRYRHRAAMTGAVTSLPGGLWAIVAAGADVQLTAAYSVRMASMIAQAYGYDTSVLTEQAHMADVLALVAGIDSLRGVGNWLTREGLIEALPRVLPKVLTRLSIELTEEQAAKWVGRIIPGVGAIVGGGIDYAFLRAAGERAIAYYHNRTLEEEGMLPPGTSELSLPSHTHPESLPAPTPMGADASTSNGGSSVKVVEGSLANPGDRNTLAVGGTVVSPLTEAARSANVPAVPVAALPAPMRMPAKPVKKRGAPERWAAYLAIFAVLAFVISIAACAALIIIITQLVSGGH